MKHVVENIICGWLLFTTSVCASYSSGHEEETEVQLKCNVSDVQQFPRMWYRGYFTINPDYKKELIYQHTASNPIECRKSSTSCRNDISADITTFEMTIGKVQLEDDDFFTCMVTYPNKEYGQQKVDVYVQPADVKMFIEIDGEPNGNETLHLKPKQNVNVTCVVERLYPELKEGNRPFTITWGDKDESSYTSAPNGNAFTYTVTMNTNVTIDHKNGTIVCKLDPAIGTSVQSGKNVTVTYGAKGTPRLVVSDPHPIPGDKVTFTCDLGNVTANPKTDRVKWTKDGDILGQAANWAEYVIERVNATHNGTYTCALGNEHGFSSDSIGVVMAANYSAFYAPRGTPQLSVDKEPITGVTVNFICDEEDMDSYFDMNLVNWTRNGSPIIDSDKTWKDKFTVEVNLNKDHTGNYSCSVGNMIGYSEFSEPVFINVLYGPIGKPELHHNVTDVTIEINPKENIMFECTTEDITSNPELTSVKWLRDGEDSGWPDTTFTYITQVTSGDYSCQVGNVIKGSPKYSAPSEPVALKVEGEKGGPGKGGGSSSIAVIVGGVVGGLAVIALVVVIVVVFLHKGQNAKNDDNRASDKVDDLPHDYADIDDLPAISISSLHSTQGYVNAPMDMNGYSLPVDLDKKDDRSSSNAVFNMAGADDERDLRHEYLEIVESNGQDQDPPTSSPDEHVYEKLRR